MTIWSAEIKELETLYSSVKDQFPELEKELERLIKAVDENMVMVYARRCLEVIITDLCESELKRQRKTEPLKGIIDKLHHEEKIPSHIIASMQNLNTLSTFGAHPKEFDPRQVKPVLVNLATIIEWYLKYKNISYKIKVKEREREEPEGVKEQIHVYTLKNKALIIISGIIVIGVIIILVFDLFNLFSRDKFDDIRDEDGRISVSVMPFQNLSSDTLYDVWQTGIQNLIINKLSNSKELSIRQPETMFDILESTGHTNYASITPSVAGEIATKLKTNTVILGNILKAGTKIRISAQLRKASTEEIYRSYEIDGDAEGDILDMTDSLSILLRDYLEIKVLEQDVNYEFREVFTKSPEAYRLYIEGMNHFLKLEDESALLYFTEAIKIDSTFAMAMFFMAWTYGRLDISRAKTVEWIKKTYEHIDQLPLLYKNWISIWYAFHVSKNYEDILKYLNLLYNSDSKSRLFWWDVGTFYYGIYEYEKAAKCFDKILELNKEWDNQWNYEPFYTHGSDYYTHVYHKVGEHEKENELYEIGLEFFPESPGIRRNQAICALSRGDTVKAKEYINQYFSIRKDISSNESLRELNLGRMYDVAQNFELAEVHYRRSLEINPDYYYSLIRFADMLVMNDIDIEEGLKLNQRALEISPGNAFRIRLQGLGYYRQGKYKQALKTLKHSDSLFVNWFDIENYQYMQLVEQALANQN